MEIGVLCVFLWLLWPVSCGSCGSFLWFLVVTEAMAVMFGGYQWCLVTILAGVEIEVVGFGWG